MSEMNPSNPAAQSAQSAQTPSVPSALLARVQSAVRDAGGWMPFDEFMAMALYEPGWGYYSNATPKFGRLPEGVDGAGSDFVTAPEMTPLFGHTLSRQVAQAM